MNKKLIYVILAIILQLALLSWIIYRYQSVLATWTRVVVPVRFYDPRDLMRWDYVNLSYDISMVSWENLDLGTWYNSMRGIKLYVVPKMNWDNVVGIESVSKEIPKDKLYFNAKILYSHTANYLIKLSIPTKSWEIIRYYNTNFFYNWTWDLVNIYYNDPNWLWFNSGSVILNVWDISEKYNYYNKMITWTVQSLQVYTQLQLDYGVDRFFIKERSGYELEQKIRDNLVDAIWRVKNWKIVIESLVIDWKTLK